MKRARPRGYPGRLPRFPVCSSGREGCQLLGFHAHCSHATAAERDRVRRWFAWFDQLHRGRA